MSAPKIRSEFPPGAPVTVEVYRVPQAGDVIVRWLGDPRGILQHWDKKKCTACPGVEPCGAYHYKHFPEWVGFAPVERWRDGQYQDWCPCVLQVSEGLHERIAGHVLRGTQWRLYRKAGRTEKLQIVGDQVQEDDPDTYPPPFSVVPAVSKCYKTTNIEWDVSLVMPPRVILKPSTGAPPPARHLPEPAKVHRYVKGEDPAEDARLEALRNKSKAST